MAIIKEVSPAPEGRLPPVTVEELADAPLRADAEAGPSQPAAASPSSTLASHLKTIVARLVPAEDDGKLR
jgi:hypothetical protein